MIRGREREQKYSLGPSRINGPKPHPEMCRASMKNSVGSVVLEILNYRQKTYYFICNGLDKSVNKRSSQIK